MIKQDDICVGDQVTSNGYDLVGTVTDVQTIPGPMGPQVEIRVSWKGNRWPNVVRPVLLSYGGMFSHLSKVREEEQARA